MELKRNTTYKLSDGQVAELRRLYGEGYTQGSLARHFGISIGQVGRIVRNESRYAGPQAGGRQATPAEADAMMRRLLAVQEEVNAQGIVEGPKRAPPPMLTEGGDVAAEAEAPPAGLTKLQERAAAYGVADSMIEELRDGT